MRKNVLVKYSEFITHKLEILGMVQSAQFPSFREGGVFSLGSKNTYHIKRDRVGCSARDKMKQLPLDNHVVKARKCLACCKHKATGGRDEALSSFLQ